MVSRTADPPLGRLKQEDHKFGASYIVTLSLTKCKRQNRNQVVNKGLLCVVKSASGKAFQWPFSHEFYLLFYEIIFLNANTIRCLKESLDMFTCEESIEIPGKCSSSKRFTQSPFYRNSNCVIESTRGFCLPTRLGHMIVSYRGKGHIFAFTCASSSCS